MNPYRILSKAFCLACFSWLCVLPLTSCSQDTPLRPDSKNEYTVSWIKTFGLISPDQDWNMATRIEGTIQLDERLAAKADELTVNVYTFVPGNPDARLMAQYPATAKTFSFDYVKGLKFAYVTLTNKEEIVVFSQYLPIINNTLSVDLITRVSRSGGTVEESRALIVDGIGTFNDNLHHNFDGIYTNASGNYSEWGIPYNAIFKTYILQNIGTYTPAEVDVAALNTLVGEGGPFQESNVTDGMCNLQKWFGSGKGLAKPISEVQYKVGEGGSEFTLDFIYGNTAKFDRLGYLYYNEKGLDENGIKLAKLKADRYYLWTDARPDHNLTLESASGGSSLGAIDNGLITNYVNGTVPADTRVVGSKRKLVYFDNEGNSSYTFPEGTVIIFFTEIGCGSESTYYGSNIRYSDDYLNSMFEVHRYDAAACSAGLCTQIYSNFVTYMWNGNIVIGVEDQVDDDMNDIMFLVNSTGDVNHQITIEDVGDDPKEVNWIIAAEDLGGSDDFDFNDVVIGISYTSGKTKAKVVPLAAGGTLPIKLMRNETIIATEYHSLFGKNSTEMINTESFGKVGNIVEIDVPADFTLTPGENATMGGFKLIVSKSGTTESINAPSSGDAPQMICVPGTWKWPKERKRINAAYSLFGEWGADYTNDWYTTPTDANLVVTWK